MSHIFRSFGELKSADKLFEVLAPTVPEFSVTGTLNINYTSNRIFMWLFSRQDTEDFINIFAQLRQPMKVFNRLDLKRKLINKCIVIY